MSRDRYANTLSGDVSEKEYAEILAQEELVVQVQISIQRLMEKAKVKPADLARLLDVKPARISQLFSDSAPNLTLRTIAKIFFVLGARCELIETLEDASSVEGEVVETKCDSDWLQAVPWDALAISEDAPLAARAVWVFQDRICAANENHPMAEGTRSTSRTGHLSQWADAEEALAYA